MDLYSGAGALGIESISRGAARASFVDHDGRAIAVLERNLQTLGIEDQAHVVAMDVLAFLGREAKGRRESFDVVFVDPPYREPLEPLARALSGAKLMSAESILVWEHLKSLDPGPLLTGFEQLRQLRAGDSTASLHRLGE